MAKRNINESGSPTRGRNVKHSSTAISKIDLNLRVFPSYFARKRDEDILNALREIQLDAKLGNPISWSKILPMLREVKINDRTAPDCLKFVMELLRLFESYHCNNATVILEVFQVLQFLTGDFRKFLWESTKSEDFFCIPYGQGKYNIDLVGNAATFANLGLLKLQLKFGMLLTTSSSLMCCIYINRFIHHWHYGYVDDKTEVENTAHYDRFIEEDDNDARIVGVGTTMTQERLLSTFNSKSIKRLGLVLKVLHIVLQMKFSDKDYKEHFTECYRLIFDSLPVPYITSREVKATLKKCLLPSRSRLIGTITENFNMLPELAEVPQPRSLKHLCRIQVRQCLRQNLNLHSGVSLLPLPTSLKAYIKLNDDGDYSVIAKTSIGLDSWENLYWTKQDSYVIPERDDCVTSFIKDLLNDS